MVAKSALGKTLNLVILNHVLVLIANTLIGHPVVLHVDKEHKKEIQRNVIKMVVYVLDLTQKIAIKDYVQVQDLNKQFFMTLKNCPQTYSTVSWNPCCAA